MSRRNLLRDRLCPPYVREETLVIVPARHTREQVHNVSIKIAEHGHVIQHFAEGVDSTTQAALDQLPCELRRPVDNAARAT